MRRRDFITLLGGAAAWPFAVHAQQPTAVVVGWLGSGAGIDPERAAGFSAGMKESGIAAENVTIEYRWAAGQYEKLPVFAADLVDRKVAVIVAESNIVSPLAAKAATAAIPIVFSIGGNPVQVGLVASLNRPGKNITGLTILAGDIVGKRLEMLREMMPKARLFALLMNPKNPDHQIFLDQNKPDPYGHRKRNDDVRHALGVSFEFVSASAPDEFEPVIADLAKRRIDALLVFPDTLFVTHRERIVAAVTRHAMPTSFHNRDSVVAGGLISYGPNIPDAYRQVGYYVGRILNGDKPADLPVVQPTKFDLVLNLKTAKALGLTVPDSLLVRATEVIE